MLLAGRVTTRPGPAFLLRITTTRPNHLPSSTTSRRSQEQVQSQRMSTPTTAVATFPHYHPHHYPRPHPHPHSPYAHSHHQQGHQPAVSANYRPAATGTANNNASSSTIQTHSILPSPWSTSAAGPSPTAATADSSSLPSLTSVTNGSGRASYHQSSNIDYQSPPSPLPPPHVQQHRSQEHTKDKYVSEAPSGQESPRDNNQYANTMAEPARKRRRSQGPDWQEFYRNGLPNEIIVIADDTPEPEANTSRKVTNGVTANTIAHVANSAATNGIAPRQPAKKRRRDDDTTTAPSGPGYHVQYVESHTNTPAASTISSDRTNSALHTTAPTSLSSQSQYDDAQLPAKRKRTTRQQAANEAKRRDTDVLGNRCFTYKPPPYPPKKASEVHVRVVQDVSFDFSRQLTPHGPQLILAVSQPPGQKNLKVDDDDGHYIVVPDASLTEKCKFRPHPCYLAGHPSLSLTKL